MNGKVEEMIKRAVEALGAMETYSKPRYMIVTRTSLCSAQTG